MLRGVSPDGRHLYPAFPYASYTRMQPQDIADLWAYLADAAGGAGPAPRRTTCASRSTSAAASASGSSPSSPTAPAVDVDTADPAVARGQYLVEGPGHCGECHTPRNFAGAIDDRRWLAGAPAPEGEGQVPNITGGEGGIGDWSAEDIVYFFETGFTPDFDSVGGSMVEVQENLAMLAGDDRAAIAAYLKAVPPQASAN